MGSKFLIEDIEVDNTQTTAVIEWLTTINPFGVQYKRESTKIINKISEYLTTEDGHQLIKEFRTDIRRNNSITIVDCKVPEGNAGSYSYQYKAGDENNPKLFKSKRVYIVQKILDKRNYYGNSMGVAVLKQYTQKTTVEILRGYDTRRGYGYGSHTQQTPAFSKILYKSALFDQDAKLEYSYGSHRLMFGDEPMITEQMELVIDFVTKLATTCAFTALFERETKDLLSKYDNVDIKSEDTNAIGRFLDLTIEASGVSSKDIKYNYKKDDTKITSSGGYYYNQGNSLSRFINDLPLEDRLPVLNKFIENMKDPKILEKLFEGTNIKYEVTNKGF